MLETRFEPYERERLRSLRSYNVLDTDAEDSYDDIVQIAASICQSPIALVTMVDENRCWFKANLGLEGATEAPRDIAYSTLVLDNPLEPTIIEDAWADDRFKDKPLATAEPPMRFFCGTPLVNEDGFVLGSLCIIDHVPRKMSEQQISAMKTLARQVVNQMELRKKMKEVDHLNEKLRDAYKEMEKFSYSISHDLKAPLRTIEGYSEILMEDFMDSLDEEAQEYLGRIQSSTRHMRVLIDSILDLSRIGRKPINRDKIDMSTLAQEIYDLLDVPDNCSINVQLGLKAVGDTELVRTLLQNLLDNAVKYSSKVDCPEVSFGRTETERGPAFFVRDNGSGFDPKYQDKMFDLFQRLHKQSDFTGTGIGLSMVKKVVEKHGGEIWAEGAVNKGATFYFTLG